MKLSRYAKYAWGVLIYNLLVILWGAYVRASGAGAGCGSHWPLCNGQVVPQSPQVHTLVEFSHRLTTGLAGLLVIGLVVCAFRLFPRGHRVRWGAALALALIVVEGLVGAAQVLLSLTADNASVARAVIGSIHLANTFVMLGAMVLTAWWASGAAPVRLRDTHGAPGGQALLAGVFAVGLLGAILVGASGAVTALGDTLFPSRTLAEGLQQDFSAASHFLIQLRVVHPILAVLVGAYSIFAGLLAAARRPSPTTRTFARALIAIFLIQMLVGVVNVALLAPIAIQIVHLMLADMVWITLVLAAAASLADPAPAQAPVSMTERALGTSHS